MVVLGRGNKQPIGSADNFPQLCHYGRRDFPFQVSVVQRQLANFAKCDSEVAGRTLDRRSQKGSVDRVSSSQAPHQSHDIKNMRQVSRHSFGTEYRPGAWCKTTKIPEIRPIADRRLSEACKNC